MTLTELDLAAWSNALDRLSSRDYAHDPVAWARDKLGVFPWSKQAEVMRATAENRLVTVQSAHGVGKTRLASWMVLWFIATRPTRTTKVVTSAPTAHQVRAVLWEYIRQGHEQAKMPGYVTQGMVPELKIDGHLVAYGRKPSDHQKSSFQGSHADHMLIVLDEAGGIPKWLWDAADSLMTSENDQHLLAIGNPDDNASHFFTVCTTEPRWTRFRISAFDSPAYTGEDVPEDVRANVVGPVYVDDKIERWGTSSPLYKVKVEGEFVDGDDGLIPLSWVRAANRRWEEWNEHPRRDSEQPAGRRVFGVDVARYGDDKTAIATRQGDVVMKVETFAKLDTTQTTGLVQARLTVPLSSSVVDVIGVGAGVVDQLRRSGHSVRAFNGSERTKRRDASGAWTFPNVRCAAWYSLRELLDPALDARLALPPDDDLTADLIAPRYEPHAGAQLWVESKDDVKKRLGRSPDSGDAVAMACWQEPPSRTPDVVLKPVSYANSGGGWRR